MSSILFYLLLFLLPTQLGRHFFFDFSSISGIRSDYLAPTIYLTDIIAMLLIIVSGIKYQVLSIKKRQRFKFTKYNVFLLLGFSYLLFNTIFIATGKWVAFYKLIKIVEFSLVGFVIYKIKPKLETIALVLSGSVFYSSIIAIWQFFTQKSIGGIFWFAGERAFGAGTPGIAAISYQGNLLMRPYATFPHPNVLGAFLALVLPFIYLLIIKNWKTLNVFLKIWYTIIFSLGLSCLFLTFSRLAWAAAVVGFLGINIKIPKKLVLPLFYLLMILSIFIPILVPQSFLDKSLYWQERVQLIKAAIPMIAQNPIFGIGLNNSIVHLRNYINNFPGIFIYQPIHNIYLLILAETGITGFIFFLWAFLKLIGKVLKTKLFFLPIIMQLFFLGLFDHYLATLQQGQLLLTIIIALAVSSRPSEAMYRTVRGEARGCHRHQAGSC